MRIALLSLILLVLMSFSSEEEPSFKDLQLMHYRVLQAYQEKGEDVFAKLKAKEVSHFGFDMFIRAFKFEEDLEVWAKNKEDSIYQLIATYKFCQNIGELGPKRKEGDKQIPEGFYNISKFNHESAFFLSLKVDYPNASDSVFADKKSPGGMIFIHGGCNTIGCIPITDEWIKEVYVFCVEARSGGQADIPIQIFPTRLTDENYGLLKEQYKEESLHKFWGQLKRGYDLFEKNNELPEVVVMSGGEYHFR